MNVQFSSASRYQFVPQTQNNLIPEVIPAPVQDSFVRFGKRSSSSNSSEKFPTIPVIGGFLAGAAAFYGTFWHLFPQAGAAFSEAFSSLFS